MGKKITWLVPELSGGIRSYSELLFPYVEKACREAGHSISCLYGGEGGLDAFAAELERESPDLVHLQHEFRLFGPTIPGVHSFGRRMGEWRKAAPKAKFLATAHSVLSPDHRFSSDGPPLKRAAKEVLNLLPGPVVRSVWLEKTWGRLDAVIVHSGTSVPIVGAYCPHVVEIPHFVPAIPGARDVPVDPNRPPIVTVFGYFSPEKGQDLAIEAVSRIRTPCSMVLAGGPGPAKNVPYFEACRARISALGLDGKVQVTGFVPDREIARILGRSTLLLAPFRATWGSGSIAAGFASGKPVLASDLLLNRELGEREPGCVALFTSGDPDDCAAKIDALLSDPSARERMSQAAKRYAEKHSPERTAESHLAYYRDLIG